MKITKEEIQKLAHLSRLELDTASEDQMVSDMNKILGFVEKIQELDLEGIAPLEFVNDEINVLRTDTVTQTITHEDALKNAPQKDSDYFKVPKVMGK
jgi:aspartyl-tRNA(Asn)/glutamyl-tRNA(Gln) amidotransferase subunit C